jgi:hypothetical protein
LAAGKGIAAVQAVAIIDLANAIKKSTAAERKGPKPLRQLRANGGTRPWPD